MERCILLLHGQAAKPYFLFYGQAYLTEQCLDKDLKLLKIKERKFHKILNIHQENIWEKDLNILNKETANSQKYEKSEK